MYRIAIQLVDERQSRDAARSTAFWLSDPLSVISRASIDGGSSSSIARATNVELPVLLAASAVERLLKRRSHAPGAPAPRRPAAVACGRPPARGTPARSERSARHEVAVGRGDHDVLREPAGRGENPRPQRADADPGAGRELEVLGEPAVEDQPLRRDRPESTKRIASPSL